LGAVLFKGFSGFSRFSLAKLKARSSNWKLEFAIILYCLAIINKFLASISEQWQKTLFGDPDNEALVDSAEKRVNENCNF